MKTRLLISFFAVLALAAAASDPAANAPPAPRLTMSTCVNEFDPLKAEKTAVGYQYWFANAALADGNTVKMSVVGPHLATHAPHRHPEEEFFFVLEGTAEFFLDGERRVVGAHSLFFVPSGRLHGIRNAGDTVLKYLVIKKYPGPVPPPTVTDRDPHAAELPIVKPASH